MPMIYSKCGDWWAARLLPIYDEKREAFARAVEDGIKRTAEQYPHCNVIRVKVDYNPDQLLLGALHKVGIPCCSYLYPTDKVFYDCWKTEMKIDRKSSTVKVSMGRGAPWEDIV